MSHYDPTDLRGLERASEQQKRAAKLRHDEECEDLKWLMSSKRGRRLVWRQMEHAGVFQSSFSTNAMQMAFNEGARNHGLLVLGLVHALCPDLYPTMVKENASGRDATSRNDP